MSIDYRWEPSTLIAVRHGQRKTAVHDDGRVHYAIRSWDLPVKGFKNGQKIQAKIVDGRLKVEKVPRCCPFCERWSKDIESLQLHLLNRVCLKFRKADSDKQST